MFPQLLYVYIKNLRMCFKDQEFCFTNDFDITLNKKKLIISKKGNPYTGLWGDKISSINLIVGKNGSGKTTLLDLIGSTKTRRMEIIRGENEGESNERRFEEWFALYHFQEDIFVIEGHNPYLIENLVNIPSGISPEYSILIKYEFENMTATFLEYIQLKEQGKSSLNEKMISLYLTNNRVRDWFSGNVIRKEQDTYVGFQRLYLNNPQYSNIYTFLSKGYQEIEKDFTAKNAMCVLKRQRIFESVSEEDITNTIKLKLYGD
ncbi:hypothetical protein V7139_28705, partial [Neobacillus drentensis]